MVKLREHSLEARLEVVKLRREDLTLGEIALHRNISKSTVQNIVEKFGRTKKVANGARSGAPG